MSNIYNLYEFESIQTDINQLQTDVSAHINDSTDPHGTTLTQTNLNIIGGIKITTTPTLDNTAPQIIARSTSDGQLMYRTVVSLYPVVEQTIFECPLGFTDDATPTPVQWSAIPDIYITGMYVIDGVFLPGIPSIVMTTPGLYIFSFSVVWTGNATGFRSSWLEFSHIAGAKFGCVKTLANGTESVAHSSSYSLYLTSSEVSELNPVTMITYGYQNSGGNTVQYITSGNENTTMTIQRIAF